MKPDDGRRLAPNWYVPLQVVLGLLLVALFFVGVASSNPLGWYQWVVLALGFFNLGLAVYEARRARRRGRRW